MQNSRKDHTNDKYQFNISLSVLNHLGRNLYRSFSTVLGEAVSNSWDADAENVYITINREKNFFSIKDDGVGMSSEDFQKKFLKVGYSKRSEGHSLSDKRRPFIGRKGIGKLALLSCCKKVHIISKTKNGEIVGGIINNAGLDAAINEEHENYLLEDIEKSDYKAELDNVERGTFLFFEDLKSTIKNTCDYLRTVVAMYFRFSTIDPKFHIFVNNKEVSVDDLKTLISHTEFLWTINEVSADPLLDEIRKQIKLPEVKKQLKIGGKADLINGFICSVELPSHINIPTTGEKVSVDLFVNGRMREKDIMRHISTNRIAERYLYGQINYNSLDSKEDPFTSSRESVKEDNQEFKNFLTEFKAQIINSIIDQWDEMRDERGKDGDSENPRIPKKQRKAKELFNATATEYKEGLKPTKEFSTELESWFQTLSREAQFNYPSYSECFLAENLTRKFIEYKRMTISEAKRNVALQWKLREKEQKDSCGMNIELRQYSSDLNYLDMNELAGIAEPGKGGDLNSLHHKAKEFRPIRNAVMHTALISNEAKTKLTSIFNEIKARIKILLQRN